MSKLNSSYLKQKFKSGGVSTEGYKRNSPDVNNPYNIIPSNQITMNDVDFPVLGIDDLGNQIMMQPGQDYTFPGSYVTEFPMKNMGNKRFGQAGMQMPIYTSDWSKVKNYNDSLNLYNKTRDIENPNYYEQGFPSWYTHRGTREEIERFMRRNNMDVDYTGRFPGNIQPVATGDFGEGIKYPIYKKPFQPYIYDPYKEFLGKLGDVKPMGLSNMDVTTEMDMTPRTVSTPNRVYKSKYPTIKVQTNYEEPGINEYNTPGDYYRREIVTRTPKQKAKPAVKETKNYKKEGGVIRQSKSQVNQTLKYSKQKPNKI